MGNIENNFSNVLREYMETCECTTKDLAEQSGLSLAVISRYVSGARIPSSEGAYLKALARGLSALGAGTESEVLARLSVSITGVSISYDEFLSNLKTLMNKLDISNVSLSKALSFDPSHVSRILSGARHPGNLPDFIEECSEYIARHSSGSKLAILAEVLESSGEGLAEDPVRQEAVRTYLSTHRTSLETPLRSFLTDLDDFDYDAFVEKIHYDKLKVPQLPFQRRNSRIYSGIEEMKNADIDWIKASVLSPSTEDIIAFSDMPISEMGEDEEFVKKYSFGLAMAMKKGLILHNIHDIHRPTEEMFLGLKSWIPLYMTGQIRPYYFPRPTGNPFHHLLKVSGGAALEGTVIHGHQKDGRYYMTKKPEEVAFYRKKAEHMLKQVKPLMHIFPEKDEADMRRYLAQHYADAPESEGMATVFGHTDIFLQKGRYARVSKKEKPAIHFIIELPQLVAAFETLF